MKVEFAPFDIAEHLKTPELRLGYLEAALEEGNPGTIALVIGDIVRAIGVAQIVKDTGISRETIYKSFKAGGNPTLATILKVSKALNLKLSFKPVAQPATKRIVKPKVATKRKKPLKAA